MNVEKQTKKKIQSIQKTSSINVIKFYNNVVFNLNIIILIKEVSYINKIFIKIENKKFPLLN